MTIELPDVNIGSQPLTSEQARIVVWPFGALCRTVHLAWSRREYRWNFLHCLYERNSASKAFASIIPLENLQHDIEMAAKLSRKAVARMIVVSDTSAITALFQIGQRDLFAATLR